MAPSKPADLIFSEQANHNFSKTLGELKRHNLSITNRLNSIIEDAAFVRKVQASWQRPLIANERCGSWYIDPALKDGSAYFKSTDGHTGVWKFSTRRLNLHLLAAIGKHDGSVTWEAKWDRADINRCIIIDSTRRGKKMPDALSKTIPIWCAVLNRALYPEKVEYHKLYVSPQVISHSEHSQICSLIDGFLTSFLSLEIDLTELRRQISKPLRPLWITPETQFSGGALIFTDYHTIICCTASRQVPSNEASEISYVQGSGDDTENWACGLTPSMFWENSQLLLTTDEANLPGRIAELVTAASVSPMPSTLPPIAPTSLVYITTLSTIPLQPLDSRRITVSMSSQITDPDTWQRSPTEIDVGLGTHKLGSRNLRTALPYIVSFVAACLTRGGWKDNISSAGIVVACSTGKDFSVGVALVLMCLFFDDNGELMEASTPQLVGEIDKVFIRRRLNWIMTALPDANPSRATLQSVNSYLMERP